MITILPYAAGVKEPVAFFLQSPLISSSEMACVCLNRPNDLINNHKQLMNLFSCGRKANMSVSCIIYSTRPRSSPRHISRHLKIPGGLAWPAVMQSFSSLQISNQILLQSITASNQETHQDSFSCMI